MGGKWFSGLIKKNTEKQGLEVTPQVFPNLEEGQEKRIIKSVKRRFAPSELVWQLLRRNAALMEEKETEKKNEVQLLVRLAEEAFAHRRFIKNKRELFKNNGLEKEFNDLEIISGRLDDLLREKGVIYQELTGLKVDEQLFKLADIQNYIKKKVTEESVVETIAPAVFYKEKLISRGKVIAATPD